MVGVSRAAYRIRQGLHALRPKIASDDMATARIYLNDGEWKLFEDMQLRDRRHALEVLVRVQVGGVTDRDLLAAALLHDCGKGAVPVWLRSLNVLAPILVRTAAHEGEGWRGAAFRLVHHPRLGAEMAMAAGASIETTGYIAGRATPENKTKMDLLRAADDAS